MADGARPTKKAPCGAWLGRLLAHSPQEEGNPLLAFGLGDLATRHQLGQESGALLAADAQLVGNVTAPLALGHGQGVEDLLLDLGVLTLGLGGLVALGGVALLKALAQRNQLFDVLGGDALERLGVDGGQDSVDGGNVSQLGVSHSFQPFLVWEVFLPLDYVFIIAQVQRFVKGFSEFFFGGWLGIIPQPERKGSCAFRQS